MFWSDERGGVGKAWLVGRKKGGRRDVDKRKCKGRGVSSDGKGVEEDRRGVDVKFENKRWCDLLNNRR